jgi:hypothetical protein
LNLYHAIKELAQYNCDSCTATVIDSFSKPTCSYSCDGYIQLSLDSSNTFSVSEDGLCPGFYSLTISDSTGCRQTRNFNLPRPDSISIVAVNIVQPQNGTPGNIIIVAIAGNYALQYSLDGVNYQQTSSFSIDSIGVYTAFVKSESGCIVQKNILITGLPEIPSFSNNWSLYPDPATDVLNVSLNLPQTANVTFSVVDILGNTVLEKVQEVNSGSNTTSIPLSTIQPGIYFLKLNAGGAVSTAKFIVAK